MARIRSERSLDATFRPRRARPFVVILLISGLVAAAITRGNVGSQLDFLQVGVTFVVMVLVMSAFAACNVTSDEPGAGPTVAFALGALLDSRETLAPRRFTGRVSVREAVEDPRTLGRVGAYFHAEPSPRERPWSNLLRLLPRLHAYLTLPSDAIRAGVGEIDVVLADGRVARIVTDAVELFDRRRVGLLESRHVVLREGDVVEVRGFAAYSEQEGAYLFEGARDSSVLVALRKRPPADSVSATA